MLVEDALTGHMLIDMPNVCSEEGTKSLSTYPSAHQQYNDYCQGPTYSLQTITSPKVVCSHALKCCQSMYIAYLVA